METDPVSNINTELSTELSYGARVATLLAAFIGLVFDGFELGLMPVASSSVTKNLLGNEFSTALDGHWFANYTAALMLGAAVGGILLGNVGDRIGRARTMGVSILFYSVFAGLGAFAETPWQMTGLRFLVGLGIGGMWPNGVVLVTECWPNVARPTVAGILGAGINVGIVCLSVLGQLWPITADSWRWLFAVAAVPALLGTIVLTALPESPQWLASRQRTSKTAVPIRILFSSNLLRPMFIGILLAAVPLIGAWAGSKWMIPWAAHVGGDAHPHYKSTTQFWWAIGATLGGLLGGPFANKLGPRRSYLLISIGATLATWAMFRLTAPLEPSFLPIVFAQGLIATLFFGWLPLFLPQMFPVHVRASGTGIAMNIGRFITAAGVLMGGVLFAWFGNRYEGVGAAFALVFAVGVLVAMFIPAVEQQRTISDSADSHQ